jgi:uncharacterized protein (DUF433 family)
MLVVKEFLQFAEGEGDSPEAENQKQESRRVGATGWDGVEVKLPGSKLRSGQSATAGTPVLLDLPACPEKRSTERGVLPWNGGLRIVKTTGNPMNLERLNRIKVDAGKCGGRPCIRGQRIRVTDVLELLGAGASFEEILADYPYLEREDILAALDYAAYQTDRAVISAS